MSTSQGTEESPIALEDGCSQRRPCLGCDAPDCSPSVDGLFYCGSNARGCKFKGLWHADSQQWHKPPPARNTSSAFSSLSSWRRVPAPAPAPAPASATPTTTAATPPPAATPPVSTRIPSQQHDIDHEEPEGERSSDSEHAQRRSKRKKERDTNEGQEGAEEEEESSDSENERPTRNQKKRRKTVTISSEENARAWLSKWVTDQGTKSGSGVFANLGIVVENGSFLVRCLSCFEADPEDEAAIVKGADICSPSFRTHIIRRHFTQGTNSKGSPHDKGQETLRMRNSMKTSLEAGQTRAREQVVTSLRLMAQLAQQENPISQFSSLASTVRVFGGNLFSTQTYQNDYGERQLLAVLAEVTDGLFHDKLEASEVLGLQVDESTDCSDSSNILMFVHFENDFYPNVGMLALKPVLSVDKGTNTIRRATGKNIAKVITDTLEKTRGITAAKVMGLATDGAAAMMGVHHGAAAYLKQTYNPYMVNVHCMAHRGSLAVSSACAGVPMTTEADGVLVDTSGYLGKSALRKVGFELVQEDMVDERLPGIKSFSKIRFLSRGNAVSAIVKNYVPLLEFFKAEGGQLAAEAFNARLQEEEAALEREASAARDGAGVLRTSLASIRQSKDTVNGMLGPELAGQGESVHAVADAALQRLSQQLSSVENKIATCEHQIAASRLQHQNVSAIEEKGNAPAASLIERLSSFRIMGILFVMVDLLGILNELNRLFQFRLLTYKGFTEDLSRTNRKLTRYFLGPNGVQNPALKRLLREVGGGEVGGEAALRTQLKENPGGVRVKYKNSNVKILIRLVDLNEVERAARSLAQAVTQELEERFRAMPLLESFSILDPQNFPVDEDLLNDYGTSEMQTLIDHFGKNHASFSPSISVDSTMGEWDNIKDIMLTVRRSPAIANRIIALNAQEKKANEAEGCGEEDDTAVVGAEEKRTLPKAQRMRKELSERFIQLYADFWRAVKNTRGGSKYRNVYKLAKIYIVQPLAPIECERGFSAQKRIKSSSRNRLAVSRLELLMRLSLAYRHQGLDLTAASSTPILEKAAVLFDGQKNRRKGC